MFVSLLFHVFTFLFNMYRLLFTVILSLLTSCNKAAVCQPLLKLISIWFDWQVDDKLIRQIKNHDASGGPRDRQQTHKKTPKLHKYFCTCYLSVGVAMPDSDDSAMYYVLPIFVRLSAPRWRHFQICLPSTSNVLHGPPSCSTFVVVRVSTLDLTRVPLGLRWQNSLSLLEQHTHCSFCAIIAAVPPRP